MLLLRLLRGVFSQGTLALIDADGHRHPVCDRPLAAVPPVVLRLHDRKAGTWIALHPELRFGEAYMDGRLSVAEGSIYDFLCLAMVNLGAAQRGNGRLPWPMRLLKGVERALRRWHQYNPLERAERNVAHHYDLSRALYALFLGTDWQYSCAYFPTGTETLDEAQTAKRRHIAAKLLPRPGLRVLDIGSGWGGMALHLAREHAMQVDGVTLSREQLAMAHQRAEEAGLGHRVAFHLRDYRDQNGRFDRIVSVGMFEHVGTGHYDQFFAKVAGLLAEDGVCLLHTIGRSAPPGSTNAWLRKYIFPGGYSPALSEVVAPIERAGLMITDIEVWRLHYAETIRHWRTRFAAAWEQARALYDERFCRMWEFYLAGCEASFRFDDMVVFQIQLAHRHEVVPVSRDYLYPSA